MNIKIRLANFFAKNSISASQPNRTIRKVCRSVYRFIMETGGKKDTKTGAKSYPYANPYFASWPESDNKRFYTLITDSAGFVIRHSASYVAWRIKCATGKWPVRPIPGPREPGEHAFDAKHWDELLEYNGWLRCEHVKAKFARDFNFIGIIPDEGEFGEVVWLEEIITAPIAKKKRVIPGSFAVTATYENFAETSIRINLDDDEVIWYGRPKSPKQLRRQNSRELNRQIKDKTLENTVGKITRKIWR